MEEDKAKKTVREGYDKIAKQDDSCCTSSCCSGTNSAQDISSRIGYTEQDLKAVPEGANLGLGCGNPVALASLKEGQVVLDLGSGAGFDCFLAARKVGKRGKVIGVDMTPAMVEKARENAEKGEYNNVEFRLGEIENLPVADSSVDVVISNCVVNLSPDKKRVFREVFRVLKPGGRMVVSDIVLLKPLPDCIKDSVEAYVGCLSGAMIRDEYIQAINSAGFSRVEVVGETSFSLDCMRNDPTAKAVIEDEKIPADKWDSIEGSVRSINLKVVK